MINIVGIYCFFEDRISVVLFEVEGEIFNFVFVQEMGFGLCVDKEKCIILVLVMFKFEKCMGVSMNVINRCNEWVYFNFVGDKVYVMFLCKKYNVIVICMLSEEFCCVNVRNECSICFGDCILICNEIGEIMVMCFVFCYQGKWIFYMSNEVVR